jgi:hypothetical protein
VWRRELGSWYLGEQRVVWHFLSVLMKGSRVVRGELSAVDGWLALVGAEYSKLPSLWRLSYLIFFLKGLYKFSVGLLNRLNPKASFQSRSDLSLCLSIKFAPTCRPEILSLSPNVPVLSIP